MKDRLWTGAYILVLAAGTFTSVSFYMISPMIAKFAVSIGATLALAGTIAGLFSITALAVRPVSGIFADRFNKKRLLLSATGVMLLSVLLYTLAQSLPVLIMTRVLHGAAFAFSGTVTVTIVASIVPRSRLGEGIGYQGMGHIIATALGPNIGIIINDRFDYRIVFLCSAAVMAAALCIMAALPDLSKAQTRHETGADTENGKNPAGPVNDNNDSKQDINNDAPEDIKARNTGNKKFAFTDLISLKVLPLAIIGGFFSLFNGIISSFLVLLGDERNIANVGIYFTVNAVCLLLVRPLAGRIADRKGLGFILIPSIVIAASAAILLGSAATIGFIIAAGILKAIGQGSGQPAIQATCIRMLPPAMSGLAASTFYIGADIGQGLGPVIGGALSQRWGYDIMFYSAAGLLLSGILIYWIYKKQIKKTI